MKRPITLAHGLAALFLWGVGALAEAASPNAALADPANARAPVPATRYEPLLVTLAAPAAASLPPENWKALNRAVAAFDSMALTMDMQGSAPAPPTGHEQHEQHQQQHQHEQHQQPQQPQHREHK